MEAGIITSGILKKVFRTRKSDSRKYDFGHLLVIGGSKLYHGSPLFAALAAYRTGTDVVTIAAPKRVADIIAGHAPDMITYPLEGDYVSGIHVDEILSISRNKTAVVVGGGLGREEATMDAVRKIVREISLPLVIDADAIYAIASRPNIAGKNFLITPHMGEFHVLSGHNVEGISLQRKIASVEAEARKMGATILLKGSTDIVSDGSRTALNRTGNPYMTKGGTGDILAGICGSLLAQGYDMFTSACAAAYINGKAGDIAARKRKQSMMASEIVDNICRAIGCD